MYHPTGITLNLISFSIVVVTVGYVVITVVWVIRTGPLNGNTSINKNQFLSG